MISLEELARYIPNARLIGDPKTCVRAISTDTRKLAGGPTFFALRGDRFDAHDFLEEAVAAGASALVVDREVSSRVPQIVVPDTRQALADAARGWRQRFTLPLIAVSGSNGKTTVTQMLAVILAKAVGEEQRLATVGNFNNEIGLPLTLLRLQPEHRLAVVEMGMNHPGEIARLASVAQPTVALVNNAQREHQEFMGSVAATAYENGASIEALGRDGIAVFPADDACAPIWRELAGSRSILDFSKGGQAAVTYHAGEWPRGMRLALDTPNGRIQVNLCLSGAHNGHNAAAAASAALAAGVSLDAIAAGLEAFEAVQGRGVRTELVTGTLLIDDAYNANPDSVRAAIDALKCRPGSRILVLGDMGEVGDQGPAFHTEIGAYAKECRIDQLFTLGDLAEHSARAFGATGAEHHASIEDLVSALKPLCLDATTVLIKGSRFMKMERVIEALTHATLDAPAP